MIKDKNTFEIEFLDTILHRLTGFSFHAVPLMDGQLRRLMDILDTSCKLNCLELLEVDDVHQIPAKFLSSVVNKVDSVFLKFDENVSPRQLRDF